MVSYSRYASIRKTHESRNKIVPTGAYFLMQALSAYEYSGYWVKETCDIRLHRQAKFAQSTILCFQYFGFHNHTFNRAKLANYVISPGFSQFWCPGFHDKQQIHCNVRYTRFLSMGILARLLIEIRFKPVYDLGVALLHCHQNWQRKRVDRCLEKITVTVYLQFKQQKH